MLRRDVGDIPDDDIVRLLAPEVVAVAQDLQHLAHGVGGVGLARELRIEVRDPRAIRDPPAIGLQWNEHLVVFVLAGEVHTPRLEDTDDLIRLPREHHDAPRPQARRTQFAAHGMAHDHDLVALIVRDEKSAVRERKAADCRIRRRGADQPRARRAAPESHDGIARHDGQDDFDVAHARGKRLGVFRLERDGVIELPRPSRIRGHLVR